MTAADIRAERARGEFNQDAVAEQLNCGRQTLSDLEAGKFILTDSEYKRICRTIRAMVKSRQSSK